MSDETPFAEVRSTPPSFFLYVGGRCLRDANVSKRLDEHAAALNSAVAARERKAAAKALREFAEDYVLSEGDGKRRTVYKNAIRFALRSRAAAIEGGAT